MYNTKSHNMHVYRFKKFVLLAPAFADWLISSKIHYKCLDLLSGKNRPCTWNPNPPLHTYICTAMKFCECTSHCSCFKIFHILNMFETFTNNSQLQQFLASTISFLIGTTTDKEPHFICNFIAGLAYCLALTVFYYGWNTCRVLKYM